MSGLKSKYHLLMNTCSNQRRKVSNFFIFASILTDFIENNEYPMEILWLEGVIPENKSPIRHLCALKPPYEPL